MTTFAPLTFHGLPVVVVPDKIVPRYQMPEDFPCSKEEREFTNAWAIRVLGYRVEPRVPDGVVWSGAGFYSMNPRTYEQLKAHRFDHLEG